MPRTTEQNEQIREAAQAKIVESAMVLFANKGYATTNMRQVAKAAGVSTGLTYHYFDSKQSLLLAVFDNCMQVLADLFIPLLEIPSPNQRLIALLNVIFSQLAENKDFWLLFNVLRTQPIIAEILGEGLLFHTTHLRSLFVMALQEMKWPDPELESYYLYSLIEGAIQQYLLDPDNYPLQQIADRIIEPYAENS